MPRKQTTTDKALIDTTEEPKERFELRAGLPGTDRDTWQALATYDTGKEAAAAQKSLAAQYRENGKALAIVRVVDTPKPDWRERERQRMADGTYKPLDDVMNWPIRHDPNRPLDEQCTGSCCYSAGDEWSGKTVQELFDHYAPDAFAHRSGADRRSIAYTPSEGHGDRDAQSRVSASVAIERLLTECPERVREYALAAIVGDSMPLFITTTPEEMVEAYKRCNSRDYVSSCMSHDEDEYSSSVHPVAVYAMGGDLALAYITLNGEQDGPIEARCLVWPEKKTWGRIYARCAQATFTNILRANGYERGDACELNGARLAKIMDGDDAYVMPYIDGYQSFSDHPTDPGSFVIGGGMYTACRTDGIVYIEPTMACSSCGGPVRESDAFNVDCSTEYCESCANQANTCYHCVERTFNDLHSAITRNWRGREEGVEICESCADSSYVYSDSYDTYLHTDIADQCGDCGETFRADEMSRSGRCESCEADYEGPSDDELEEASPAPVAPTVEVQPLIDWTQPIEYADGRPASYFGHHYGEHIVDGNYYDNYGNRTWDRSQMSVRNVIPSTAIPAGFEGELRWGDGETGRYIRTITLGGRYPVRWCLVSHPQGSMRDALGNSLPFPAFHVGLQGQHGGGPAPYLLLNSDTTSALIAA